MVQYKRILITMNKQVNEIVHIFCVICMYSAKLHSFGNILYNVQLYTRFCFGLIISVFIVFRRFIWQYNSELFRMTLRQLLRCCDMLNGLIIVSHLVPKAWSEVITVIAVTESNAWLIHRLVYTGQPVHSTRLTRWGRVKHICVCNLTIIGSENGPVAWSAPGHYLNQWWNIVNWTNRNKLQWNFNQNHNIFIQENAFENVVWKTAAILSRLQCVKGDIASSRHPLDFRRVSNPLISFNGYLIKWLWRIVKGTSDDTRKRIYIPVRKLIAGKTCHVAGLFKPIF